MKKLVLPAKILTILAAASTILLFFLTLFTAVTKSGTVSLTGFQMAFGTTIDKATLFKSAYYLTAFILSAFVLLFTVLSYKYKGTLWAAIVANFFSAINLGVITFSSISAYADTRALKVLSITRQPIGIALFITAIASLILCIVTVLIVDYVEVLESKGAKKPIFKRIKQFLKDYKSELKKITWPTKNNVIKNFIAVIAVCAILGAYIWALDFGLAKLVALILGIES